MPLTVLPRKSMTIPELPAGLAEDPRVVRWWETWKSCELAPSFTATDWQFLLDTAYLAAAFYDGDMKVAGELRLRAAKFGATPEDRARLRVQVTSAADKTDARRERQVKAQSPSRERYAGLRAVEEGTSA